MDLSKIKTLIDFVGRSNVTELSVTEKDVTVRIFRNAGHAAIDVPVSDPDETVAAAAKPVSGSSPAASAKQAFQLKAPVFGILHRASAPGQEPFVRIGDLVEEGQTLFIIEAMKVFNTVAAPLAGRVAWLTEIDGVEVEVGDVLAEIA
ncbi:acetyl-CoA carboxylase biotin carboxyl carrier protein [Neorhizobium galegae]|uniref:Biotin carboxyl carrier protein of acetyl-CoA carboxylase n=1 Tax=Neorhizobium galegae bv. orientalis str. HAMBI 540 TaxID=1028800 RepID=A0A068SYN4_NEOGA|nr:acetyl-CoA carboxylase biotin carboxyl carrier protein subunit [Neorhizobium galegae]CDN50916.1 Acetyl-CoA carboxylase, biotin carboxyl carrier protein [Neorhizobium galegae bv. orientalis str. HAMBI 540]CDZ43816.1 Biotin carboxyl carrier protein [Neorhizobium galegae bv. orientalis]